jgi:hypothetical protein
MARSSRPRIEILVFDGCPNAAPTRELVERIASQLSVKPEIVVVVVPDAEAAERAWFLGSPTVRVNGLDIEPGAEARRDYSMSCRVYQTAGVVAGQPDETWLRDALDR